MDYTSIEQRFGTYNREILSQRSLFFKNCQISDLDKLIQILQYETSSIGKNFRWGQRYFNNSQHIFNWLSSTNGKIKVSYPNRYTHEIVSYDKPVFYSEEMVKENCLSHLKNKRKLSLYYKHKKNNQKYDDLFTNLYMMNKKTYGLSQKNNTDVLWLDIDNHDSEINTINVALLNLKKICELLNITLKDFLYIEANIFNGGIHGYLKLPFSINDNPKLFSDIEKKLNEIANVECNFQTKLLRLPLSYEYLPLKRDDRILDKNNLSKEDFIETFNETLENVNNNPIKLDYFIENNLCPIKIDGKSKLQKLRKKLNKEETPIEKYWSTPKYLVLREKLVKPFKERKLYTLNNGERFETFRTLIPYLKLAGKSFEEVCDILRDQQVDSKDMNHFDKLIPDIRKYYNKINIQPKSFGTYQKYISNKSFLSDITLKFFEDEDFQRYITEKFIKNYVKVRNYKNDTVSDEKYNILIKQIPYFLKELIGKMYYDIENPKYFKSDKMNHYIGFQLSYKELNLIQEQSIKDLDLPESPLNRTSLQYLKKALLLTLDIEEIENTSKGKRNWIKGSCKSYRINSINDIRNVLNHFYTSCFRDIVFNNFIIHKNNIYTLYILLIENYELLDYDDVMFILNHVPIPIDT